MNTIMEEKIKQAFQEWKQADQPKEKDMEENISNNRKLSNVLLDKVKDNPGITGKALRAYISQAMPIVPITYVPAMLKGFYDANVVSREVVPPLLGSRGGSTFAYTFIPEGERKKMPKREKAKAHTKKKAKAKPVCEDKGITTLIPAERKPVRPLEVGPTTLHITISTSLGAYSMKLDEAKFIYSQLNQIFGGAR
jgi:hypothetical protein